MTTFPDLLSRRLKTDPASPFVTFYDDATGERTELSVTTYANWVSKSANLLTEELMLDPGDAIRIELPPHWLGVVFAGAVACCGIDRDDVADVAIVGPDALDTDAKTVMATALHPFATRFSTALPAGVLDHGTLWAGQSDVFVPIAPAELDVAEPDDRRVITDLDPLSPAGTRLLVSLLAGGGSMVLVANPEASRWPAHSQSERATASVRATAPI